jgi:hypothetical protein
MIFARSRFDPLGTPILPDPQEEDWTDEDTAPGPGCDDEPDGDEPEDWRHHEQG